MHMNTTSLPVTSASENHSVNNTFYIKGPSRQWFKGYILTIQNNPLSGYDIVKCVYFIMVLSLI